MWHCWSYPLQKNSEGTVPSSPCTCISLLTCRSQGNKANWTLRSSWKITFPSHHLGHLLHKVAVRLFCSRCTSPASPVVQCTSRRWPLSDPPAALGETPKLALQLFQNLSKVKPLVVLSLKFNEAPPEQCSQGFWSESFLKFVSIFSTLVVKSVYYNFCFRINSNTLVVRLQKICNIV